MVLLGSWGSKQRHNLPYSFQAYTADETQSIGSSTRVMTWSFTILYNSALTLGNMEIGHCHSTCVTGWVLSHSLVEYLLRNWPMPQNLSGNSLMRSSVDLTGVVFLGAVGAGAGLGGSEVFWWLWQHNLPWWLLTFHRMGAKGWQDWGCLPHTNSFSDGFVH